MKIDTQCATFNRHTETQRSTSLHGLIKRTGDSRHHVVNMELDNGLISHFDCFLLNHNLYRLIMDVSLII